MEVLKIYADDLGIKGRTWLFVTGNREKIYDIGEKHFLVTFGRPLNTYLNYIQPTPNSMLKAVKGFTPKNIHLLVTGTCSDCSRE